MTRSSKSGDPDQAPNPTGPGGDGGRATARPRPPINEALQQVIGAQLKAAYDEIVSQPVPERFLELLHALEAKQGEGR
ncbi:NepR family anti-sigma factor [Chelatococcus sp. SYSU_G07232]|uniref:NepR family anti-sigma factor n=1 Tax=Chelatococcus albus TaxID=3047466 RepID=A0ABT7AIW3_9HYPH|nr:NepR family anti-sigma factor [Chelatococcus sp. SYSU_G07232]MDJ1158531.1 NepR family anti-sigma factor [Chelatococcus sp. SYSU_G07232]